MNDGILHSSALELMDHQLCKLQTCFVEDVRSCDEAEGKQIHFCIC
jgi:hypothetical protein